MDVLRSEPERLSEVKGISRKRAAEIADVFREKADYQDLSLLLTPFGFGSARIMSIYKRFGPASVSVLKKNPFRLVSEVSGIGFRTADVIAQKFGCDPGSPFRIGSAMQYLMLTAESEGHTYLAYPELIQKTRKLLSSGDFSDNEVNRDDPAQASFSIDRKEVINDGILAQGFEWLLDSSKITAFRMGEGSRLELARITGSGEDVRVSLPNTLKAEVSAAKILCRMIESQDNSSGIPDNEVISELSDIAKSLSIDISGEQVEALLMAVRSPCSVITGGPGTGKTTIVAVLVRYFRKRGIEAALCAPTGRAAKRLSEACGFPAQTIHRMLEVGRPEIPGERFAVFGRNEDNPIEVKAVIVDETSMLDTMLLDALLRALPHTGRLVFIGDKDQLPSVGAGNVLADMIDSGSIPCYRLKTIFRQAEQSRIVLSAHAVLEGKAMIFDQSLQSDCMLVNKGTGDEIADAVKSLYSSVLPNVYGIDAIREAVVLCPSRKGPAGVTSLNPLLQQAYGTFNDRNILSNGYRFCIGDRVMQTRNDYELPFIQADGASGLGVFNGELGIVIQVDPREQMLTVELDDGRIVRYDRDRLEDLDPAFAMTVHKSQGSEFSVVILAIPSGPPLLNNRNLLYTAITRARKKLFIVSDRPTLARMIHNRSQAERFTSLKDFIALSSREKPKKLKQFF
jgi:exodeoxyribonuclease V alpha subunit